MRACCLSICTFSIEMFWRSTVEIEFKFWSPISFLLQGCDLHWCWSIFLSRYQQIRIGQCQRNSHRERFDWIEFCFSLRTLNACLILWMYEFIRANCHQRWTRRLWSCCRTDGYFPLQCRCGFVAQLDDRVVTCGSINRFWAGATVCPIAGLVADNHEDDRVGHWWLHMPCQNYPGLGRRQGHSHRSR